MAIQDEGQASGLLRDLLDRGHNDVPFAAKALDGDFELRQPEGWLWATGAKRPGLRDPAAYAELQNAHPALKDDLHKSPAEALGPRPAAATGGSPAYSDAQTAYLRSSIDVTMKGGVTSGVIYPLALCELAREFRLRNVGGASAGAIAASFAAAAEVGRATIPEGERVLSTAEFRETSGSKVGRCRRGFVGLADMIAWLAQVDDDARAKEEFRTAQLFKPTDVAMRLFRLVAAVMRKRYWALPVLAATSFGTRLRVASVLFVFVLPLLLSLITWLVVGEMPSNPILVYLTAAGWLGSLSIAVFGFTIAVSLLIGRALTKKRDAELAEKAPQSPLPKPKLPTPTSSLPYVVMFLLGSTAAVLISLFTETWPWLGFSRSTLAWLLGVLTVLGLMIGSIGRLIRRAKIHRFGLVGGSAQRVDLTRLGHFFNRLVGMPKVTVDHNMTEWLDQCLSDLAGIGQDDTSEGVLRFGHIWDKDYTAPSDPGHPVQPSPRIVAACADPEHRMVNLELMSTELVHRVPYRFPLAERESLYFQPSDLETIFPRRVIAALRAGPVKDESQNMKSPEGQKHNHYRNVDTGEKLTDLCRLPDPWDLPVVFAVRISMAFPGLFEAVKLYRKTADPLPKVRDDFGAPIILKEGKEEVTYPASGKWMQELWFSDGGITSNFPIHFFDGVLPRWPTVGINLGPHPKGFEHQDVYLPSDRQASNGVPAPLGHSMISFLSSVVDTARNWRDTSQTFLPASRGRIAWVRQRSYEGGSNLFMPRDRLAALALRGAVAGARLRRRFASEGQWQRHQWLRLRVGLSNLADLHTRVQQSLREARYAKLGGGGDAATDAMSETIALLKTAADPTPPGPNPFNTTSPTFVSTTDAAATHSTTGATPKTQLAEAPFEWFPPKATEFWSMTQALLAADNRPLEPIAILSEDAPQPSAALRQVPRI